MQECCSIGTGIASYNTHQGSVTHIFVRLPKIVHRTIFGRKRLVHIANFCPTARTCAMAAKSSIINRMVAR